MTKHDSKTTDELILENAAEGATHIDNNGFYLKASTSGYMDFDNDGRDWDYDYANHCHTRSLADITELVELRKKNAELEKERDEAINRHYALASHLRGIIQESTGVAGYHLNGDIAEWDDFDLCIVESERLLAIRDLKQQAKGIEYLIKNEITIARLHNSQKRSFIFCQDANKYANQLREQAKQLKGGDL